MEKEKRENKENMGNWKTVSLDFASLYTHSFGSSIRVANIIRKITIRKIWKL